MVDFNDPPQPVLTPISNAVNYEERVSILLNGSGSTYENPVVSSNYLFYDPGSTSIADVDNALADSNAKGAAIAVKFGLADSSETIESAHIRTIDTVGNQTSSKSIRSSFVKDTKNNYFSADLFAGSDFPAGTSTQAQRSFIDIRTNLGRSLRQQIYTQKAPDNAVLINGLASTSNSYAVVNPIEDAGGTLQSLSVSNTFFPTWNDEIARQHGASSVGLAGLISKPYGGMKTVQVLRRTLTGHQEVVPEKDIRLSSTLDYQAGNSDEDVTFIYVFRSKEGSKHTVVFAVYLNYTTCGTGSGGGGGTVPPDVEDPGGGIFDNGGVIIDQGGYGILDGTAASASTITLTGYKGGVIDDSGATAVSDILIGSVDYPISGTPPSNPITLTIANTILVDASLIIAEVANGTDSTVKGNSLVYTRGNTDIEFPEVPQISVTPTYDFGNRMLVYTVDDTGWPGETVTVRVKPFYGTIKNTGGSAQASSDLGAWVAEGEVTTTTTAIIEQTVTLDVWSSGIVPDAVEITFSNSFGYSNSRTYIKNTNTAATLVQDVKKGPRITTASYQASGLGPDGVNFIISDQGNQPTSQAYDFIYYRVSGSQVNDEVKAPDEIAVAGTGSYIIPNMTSANNGDTIIFHIKGDQGSSNTLKIGVSGHTG